MKFRKIIPALVLSTVLAGVAGCASTGQTIVEEDVAQSEVSQSTDVSSSTEEIEDDDIVAYLVERDQFIKDQKITPGTKIAPITEEQKAFITEQKALIEEEGLSWDDEVQHIFLAAALEACETSILNGHEIDENVVRQHMLTDPMLGQLSQELTTYEKNMFYLRINAAAARGMAYICPEDAANWTAASLTVFPLFAD